VLVDPVALGIADSQDQIVLKGKRGVRHPAAGFAANVVVVGQGVVKVVSCVGHLHPAQLSLLHQQLQVPVNRALAHGGVLPCDMGEDFLRRGVVQLHGGFQNQGFLDSVAFIHGINSLMRLILDKYTILYRIGFVKYYFKKESPGFPGLRLWA